MKKTVLSLIVFFGMAGMALAQETKQFAVNLNICDGGPALIQYEVPRDADDGIQFAAVTSGSMNLVSCWVKPVSIG